MDFRKIFLIFICFLYISCEKTFEINIDGNVSSKEIYLECSTITISGYCVSRSYLYIFFTNNQKEGLPCIISFYPESLFFEFKNENIPYKIQGEDKTIDILDNLIYLENRKAYRISMNVNSPTPYKGDTIVIKDNGYLYCNGKRVDIGDINIIIK